MGEQERLVHYGAISDSVLGTAKKDGRAAERRLIVKGQASGNIGISLQGNDVDDTLPLSADTLLEQQKHAETLRNLSRQWHERSLLVSTDDDEVKSQLRALGEPICLFGEREPERRDRLRRVFAKSDLTDRELQNLKRKKFSDDDTNENENERPNKSLQRSETFYTVASPELIEARKKIANFSWAAAERRLCNERSIFEDADRLVSYEDSLLSSQEEISKIEVLGSQVGDTRPVSCCAFSKDSFISSNTSNLDFGVATGSFKGVIKLWNQSTFSATYILRGHDDRIASLQFSGPQYNLLASASADNTARIWNTRDAIPTDTTVCNETSEASDDAGKASFNQGDIDELTASENKKLQPEQKLSSLMTLNGHALRLAEVSWHPMEHHLATTSYDHTWRLWDASTGKELLLQEGHEAPVYAMNFHKDGSLALSGDLVGLGRLWDIRSGKSIHSLLGHADGLITADFSLDGIQLATGSLDHSVRVWDLRSHCKPLSVIPAHMHAVSRVRFDPINGAFLATASYDRSFTLWANHSYEKIKEFKAHEHLVMDLDLSLNSPHLVTCSYDRTWKLWGSLS